VTGALAVAGTALYIDVSPDELLRLLAAAWAILWTVDVALEARLIRRRLKSVTAWLERARGERQREAAWEAAAGLPLAYVPDPLVWALVVPARAAWDLYGPRRVAAAILFVSSSVVFLYWVVVRLLAIEISLRPVLEDIASSPPDGAELEPLRWPLTSGDPRSS
jgi:adenylate cyclase